MPPYNITRRVAESILIKKRRIDKTEKGYGAENEGISSDRRKTVSKLINDKRQEKMEEIGGGIFS